jgi:hypothetical protein
MMDKHNLPVIPIISQTISGSNLYADKKYRIQPFLYAAYKSNLPARMDLALTMLYYNIFTFGSSPTYTFRSSTRKALTVDWTIPGGVIGLEPAEEFAALTKQIVNPEMVAGLQKAEELIQDSTIQDAALGQPIGTGANVPYSSVALMNQMGRLPLMQPQRRGSWAFSNMIETAMLILKESGKKVKIANRDEGVITELAPAEIPDGLMVDATLNVDLPQDDRMNALIAVQLTSGDRPLTSYEYARSKILGVEQSDEMDNQINAERMTNAIALASFQKTVQQGMNPTAPTEPGTTQPGTGQPTNPAEMPQPGAQPGMPLQQPIDLNNPAANVALPGENPQP